MHQARAVSKTFLWRRVHSLMGLWLVLFLIEHLIVNSQAALWIGDYGIGFIRLVNLLEALPFLQVLEFLLIGFPILVHGYWGVKRALKGKANSYPSEGDTPYIKSSRNRAYTWQRLSSWILLGGIIAHVVQMRFVEQPTKYRVGDVVYYEVVVSKDPGLDPVAKKVGVQVKSISENEAKITATQPGKAMLFMVRDTFKSPLMSILYSVFVIAACFHAFNGLWTSLITWGVLLSYRSQKALVPICYTGAFVMAFLGLAAIWGSYWINLRT